MSRKYFWGLWRDIEHRYFSVSFKYGFEGCFFLFIIIIITNCFVQFLEEETLEQTFNSQLPKEQNKLYGWMEL